MNRTARLTAALALTGALTLTGCSTAQDAPNDTPAVSGAPVVVESEDAAAVEATAAPVVELPAPVADEFSQVVNGVLYVGTEKAPVRIGTDTPGQAPAAEAAIPQYAGDMAAVGQAAIDANKYLVTVYEVWSDGVGGVNGGTLTGYRWVANAVNSHGNFRGVAQSAALPTVEAASAGPFVVEGRTLDRAEYVVRVVID